LGNELGKVRESHGDQVSFVTVEEGRVSYGQIVKICSGDGRRSKVFYSRITNAGSRSTLEEVHELQDLRGSMRTVGPYSQYRYVESVLFLEREGSGDVRTPTLNPEYGWAVKPLEEADYSVLKLQGDLKLGCLRAGLSDGRRTVGLDVECIPRMMATVGQIGSGKTNAELVLNSALIATGGKAVGLIFDFAGELLTGKAIGKGLADSPFAEDGLVYFGLENPEKPVSYAPIQIGLRRLSPKKLYFLLPDFSQPQEHYALKLRNKLGSEDWISKAIGIYENEDVNGLLNIAEGQRNVAGALLRKLCSLDERVFPDVDHDFTADIIRALTGGRSVLVDISGLREGTQKQIVTWVAGCVVRYYRDLWRTDYEAWKHLPYLLITLEEAHKFLEEKGTIFSDIALTYRKYRVGLNAVTPRPSSINRDVFAELWTKIILKTNLKDDRQYLAENTPYLEYSDVELKMLDVGEALVVSQPRIHFAVPIRVYSYKEYLEEHLEKAAEQLRDLKPPRRLEIKRSEIEENVL